MNDFKILPDLFNCVTITELEKISHRRIMKIGSFKLAFTIAEILIVLGIVGIVAEMVIPDLIVNIQTQQTIVALKESYSVFSQALKMSEIDNGKVDSWACTDASCYFNRLTPYLSISKNCGVTVGQGCFPKGYVYPRISGGGQFAFDDEPGYPRAALADGMPFMIEFNHASCGASVTTNPGNLALNNVCAGIYVDVNGTKPPNVCGRDMFSFWITKYGIIPKGMQDDTSNPLATQCSNKSGVGYGCTAWVIYKQNMNYMNGAVSW